jgi:hypothetical protein
MHPFKKSHTQNTVTWVEYKFYLAYFVFSTPGRELYHIDGRALPSVYKLHPGGVKSPYDTMSLPSPIALQAKFTPGDSIYRGEPY